MSVILFPTPFQTYWAIKKSIILWIKVPTPTNKKTVYKNPALVSATKPPKKNTETIIVSPMACISATTIDNNRLLPNEPKV